MLGAMLEVLEALGVLAVIQVMVIATGAIFLYRYFTDRG